MSDMDVDGILAGIESPSTEIPMSSTQEAPAQEIANQQPSEYEFTWNGKQIKAPVDKLTKWASQGYDYAQRMEQFKAEREAFETQRQQFEPRLNTYKEVDDYANKNPDWWKHVEASYKERQQNIDPSNPISGELQQLKSELSELKSFRDQLTQEKMAERQKTEDAALESEVSQLRQQHKDLDWNSADENGHSLEQRVLKHASENGINSFRAAFRDYNHDQLLKLTELRAREAAMLERQKVVKSGLLGQSPTPKKGLQTADNVKGKSYNNLVSEALSELGIR